MKLQAAADRVCESRRPGAAPGTGGKCTPGQSRILHSGVFRGGGGSLGVLGLRHCAVHGIYG